MAHERLGAAEGRGRLRRPPPLGRPLKGCARQPARPYQRGAPRKGTLQGVAQHQERAALELAELLAAQPGVAEHEHDREVARAGEWVVGDPRPCLMYQSLILRGAERLRRRGLIAPGAREPRRERLADLLDRHVLMGEPAQERVQRGAVLFTVAVERPPATSCA